MKVLTAEQMQGVDRRTIDEIGLPGAVLMENAGRGVAEAISSRFARGDDARVVVMAGKGNNGGDGYVVARLLRDRGWDVQTIVLSCRDAIQGDALRNLTSLINCGGPVHFAADDQGLETALAGIGPSTLLIDALFGTGLAKPVQGLYLKAINWLNLQPSPVISVDIPSGVDGSTGRVLGAAVKAALTVTFAFAKVGHVSYPGAGLVGELVVADIGVPSQVAKSVESDCLFINAEEAKAFLPHRRLDGHKGSFGHLLVVAGSLGKSGAAVMAAESGLRSGAGLVSLACPVEIQQTVASRLTEAMTVSLEAEHGEVSLLAYDTLLAQSLGKQALAVGPGIGLRNETSALVRRLVRETDLPIIIDADGLTALCGHLEIVDNRLNRQIVLTPHPGEMARLTGLSVAEIEADRFSVARAFARAHGVVLVLKGARTLVAAPDGRVHVNSSGHAGLASGGMGDVLTGLIGGFLAQGLTALDAATLAVYLHGRAADQLLKQFGDAGLLATDVMSQVPAARQALARES